MSLSELSYRSVQNELLPNMANWRSTWDATTQYFRGDIVQGGDNNGYVANVANVGEDPVNGQAPSPWTTLSSSGASGGMNFAGNPWSASATYGNEDVVVGTNGASYVAKSTNSNVNPLTDVLDVSGSKWVRLSGANTIQQWNSAVQYGVGDMVQATQANGQNATFQCAVPNSNSAPALGNNNWVGVADEIGSSMSYVGAWSGSTSYDKQDVVSLAGFAYVSLSNANSNNNPASAPTFWTPMAGAGSVPVIHYKSASGAVGTFANINNITASNAAGILPLPTGGQANVNGVLSLAGLFGNGGSNVNADNYFQVSDVSGSAPTLARFSEQFVFTNQASGLTPVNMDLNYSFSNLTGSNLYLNVVAGSNGWNAHATGNTNYQYANTITPVVYAPDP